MTEHTKGPFKYVENYHGYSNAVVGDDHIVALLYYWSGSENCAEVRANADLFVSAPDMETELTLLRAHNAKLLAALEDARGLLKIWRHDMADCDVMDHYDANFGYTNKLDGIDATLEETK